MPNMSYCRFTNTLKDLRDCYDSMSDNDLSDMEQKAREEMILLCNQIADDYEMEIANTVEKQIARVRERQEAKS